MRQAELMQEQDQIPQEDQQKCLRNQDLDQKQHSPTELCEMLHRLAEWKIIPATLPRMPAQEPEIPA